MVHVEEREPLDGVGEDDEECVEKLGDFREVEDVGPEKEWARGRGVTWQADDPVEVRCTGYGGDYASEGHDEGEGEEKGVVDG